MNIKKYRVEHEPTNGAIVVEIDFDFKAKWGDEITPVKDIMKEMVLFFYKGDQRLENNDGDVVKTFLIQFCELCCRLMIEYNYNTDGLIGEFEDGYEGYVKMNGEYGIKLVDSDVPTMDYEEDYLVEEIKDK